MVFYVQMPVSCFVFVFLSNNIRKNDSPFFIVGGGLVFLSQEDVFFVFTIYFSHFCL